MRKLKTLSPEVRQALNPRPEADPSWSGPQLSIGKKRIKAKVAPPESEGEARVLTALLRKGGRQLLREGAYRL